jgi:hypothetical protein
MIAFRTFWQACINIFEDLFIVLLANVMWVIIALPLPYLAVTFLLNTTTIPGGILMLLLIPFAFAFAGGGLTYLARQIIDGKAVRIPDVWYGMRFQYKRQLQLYALWCVVLYTLAFNMWFYSQTTGNLQILTFLFFYLTIFWMMYLAFLMPLSRRFPDHSIRLLMRNAAGLMFTVAGSMVIMLVLTTVLLAVSLVSVIVMVFFFAIFTTLWGTHMVDAAIKIIEDRESTSEDDGDTHDAARRPAGQIRPRE